MQRLIGFLALFVVLAMNQMAWAGEFDALIAPVNGKVGTFGVDARVDDRVGPVKTGCHGGVYSGNITLSNPRIIQASGSLAPPPSGDGKFSVQAQADFSGLHVEENFGGACVNNGTHRNNVNGVVTFTLGRNGHLAKTEGTLSIPPLPPYADQGVRAALAAAYPGVF